MFTTGFAVRPLGLNVVAPVFSDAALTSKTVLSLSVVMAGE